MAGYSITGQMAQDVCGKGKVINAKQRFWESKAKYTCDDKHLFPTKIYDGKKQGSTFDGRKTYEVDGLYGLFSPEKVGSVKHAEIIKTTKKPEINIMNEVTVDTVKKHSPNSYNVSDIFTERFTDN